MPSQLPNNRQQNPRHRVVEVMTRAQEDALRQLRVAGIPETEALAVIQRFSVFSVQVLRELDLLRREYEQLRASDPDRSRAHQEWFDTKVGGMLLTMEAFIAALVAEALNKAKEEYRQQVSQPREVVSVPAQRARAAPQEYPVPVWWLLLWMSGIAASTLFSWHASASIIWAGIGCLVPLLLWCKVGKVPWALIFPLSGIGMEVWLVLWHVFVEGGF
jgi:hypothetical protein